MRTESGSPDSPHAPVLGLTHRLLGRLHVTGVFWYRLPYWAATHLPSFSVAPVVLISTACFFLTLGRIRKAIASNLEPVLGPADRVTRHRRSWRTMHAFAWCLFDRYRRVSRPAACAGTLIGEEHLRTAMAGSRGVLLTTAHIGPWDAAVQLGTFELRRRIHVVREKEIDPRAQLFVTQLLSRDGCVTHFAGDDLVLGVELVNALRAGDIVALQGDRPRTTGRSVEVTVFGRRMPLPEGPAALARAAGVPVLPVFNFREKDGTILSVMRPPIEVARTADRQADITVAAERLAAEIEWAIGERPHQWFCFRRLWHY